MCLPPHLTKSLVFSLDDIFLDMHPLMSKATHTLQGESCCQTAHLESALIHQHALEGCCHFKNAVFFHVMRVGSTFQTELDCE